MKISVELYRISHCFQWRIRYGSLVINGPHPFLTKQEAREHLAGFILELRRDAFEVYDLTQPVVKACERVTSSKRKAAVPGLS
jgi:hypothetical protein